MSLVLCSWSWVKLELCRSRELDIGPRTDQGLTHGPSTKAPGHRTYLAVDFLFDSVLFELLVQIAAGRVDDLGGLRDVPGILAQLLHEIRPLGGVFERSKRCRACRLSVSALRCRCRLDGWGSIRVAVAHIGRQIIGAYDIGWRHDHQPLDGVAQFANVASPAIALQCLERGRVEAFRLEVVLFRRPLREMLYESRDVLAPLAERRHHDGNDVEAEVEIFT